MISDNQQITENGQYTCNHNYLDIKNTLIGVPKIKMVTPANYYLKCKQCGQIIVINKADIDNIQDFMHTFF